MVEEQKCLECEKFFISKDMVQTEDGAFCMPCYDAILKTVKELAQFQNTDINYLFSAVGGILGAGLGMFIWWAVTFYSGYAVGIVAIVIGVTTARGITLFNGNKRSQQIQMMAVVMTILSYFYASYLVTRSFVLKQNSAQYIDILTLVPTPEVFFGILKNTFNVFNLVFLGIAVWQAWTMTKPFKFE